MLPLEPNTPANSRIWRIVHFPLTLLVIAIGMLVLGGALTGFVIHAVAGPPRPGDIDLLGRVLSTAAIVLIYWVFVRFVERHPVVPDFARPGWLKELGGGWVAGFLLFSSVAAVIAVLGGYSVVGTNPASVLLIPIIVTFCTGFAEEILLRGIFFRLTERLLGSWIALALSAALFGALHLGNPNATLLAGAAIALEAGIMLAALYMLTRRLWAAIGLHAAWNFAQGAVYGIAVSGFDQKGVLVPRITGSDLLTGGSFGAEASLPAIIIDTAFGIVLLVIAYRRGRFVAPVWARHQGTAAQE